MPPHAREFVNVPKGRRKPELSVSSVTGLLKGLSLGIVTPLELLMQCLYGRPGERHKALKLASRSLVWLFLFGVVILYDATEHEGDHIQQSELVHPIILFCLYQVISNHRRMLELRHLTTGDESRLLATRLTEHLDIDMDERAATGASAAPHGDRNGRAPPAVEMTATGPGTRAGAAAAAADGAGGDGEAGADHGASHRRTTKTLNPLNPLVARAARVDVVKAKAVLSSVLTLELIIPERSLSTARNGGHMYLSHLLHTIINDEALARKKDRWKAAAHVADQEEGGNHLSPMVYITRIWEFCQPFGLIQRVRRMCMLLAAAQAAVPSFFRLEAFHSACENEPHAFWNLFCSPLGTPEAAVESADVLRRNASNLVQYDLYSECRVYIHFPDHLDQFETLRNCPTGERPYPMEQAPNRATDTLHAFFAGNPLVVTIVFLVSWYWAYHIMMMLAHVSVTYLVRLRVMRVLSDMFSGNKLGCDFDVPDPARLERSKAARRSAAAFDSLQALPILDMRNRRQLRAAYVISDQLKKASECYIHTGGLLPCTYFILPCICFSGYMLLLVLLQPPGEKLVLTNHYLLVLLDTFLVLLFVMGSLGLALRSNLKQELHAGLLEEYKLDVCLNMQERSPAAQTQQQQGAGRAGGGAGRSSGARMDAGGGGADDAAGRDRVDHEAALTRTALGDLVEIMRHNDAVATFYGIPVTVPLLAKVFTAVFTLVGAQLGSLFANRIKLPTPTPVDKWFMCAFGGDWCKP